MSESLAVVEGWLLSSMQSVSVLFPNVHLLGTKTFEFEHCHLLIECQGNTQHLTALHCVLEMQRKKTQTPHLPIVHFKKIQCHHLAKGATCVCLCLLMNQVPCPLSFMMHTLLHQPLHFALPCCSLAHKQNTVPFSDMITSSVIAFMAPASLIPVHPPHL